MTKLKDTFTPSATVGHDWAAEIDKVAKAGNLYGEADKIHQDAAKIAAEDANHAGHYIFTDSTGTQFSTKALETNLEKKKELLSDLEALKADTAEKGLKTGRIGALEGQIKRLDTTIADQTKGIKKLYAGAIKKYDLAGVKYDTQLNGYFGQVKEIERHYDAAIKAEKDLDKKAILEANKFNHIDQLENNVLEQAQKVEKPAEDLRNFHKAMQENHGVDLGTITNKSDVSKAAGDAEKVGAFKQFFTHEGAGSTAIKVGGIAALLHGGYKMMNPEVDPATNQPKPVAGFDIAEAGAGAIATIMQALKNPAVQKAMSHA